MTATKTATTATVFVDNETKNPIVHETLENGESSNIVINELTNFIRNTFCSNGKLTEYINEKFKTALTLLGEKSWNDLSKYD